MPSDHLGKFLGSSSIKLQLGHIYYLLFRSANLYRNYELEFKVPSHVPPALPGVLSHAKKI